MKYSQILVVFFLLFQVLYPSDAPKNEVEFQQTMARMFKDYQYPFLAEYLEEYGDKIKSETVAKNVLLLTLYMPEKAIKSRMFEKLLELTEKKMKGTRDVILMEYGKFAYSTGNWKKAIELFEKSKHEMSYYYSAWSYYRMRDYVNTQVQIDEARKNLVDKKWSYYVDKLSELEVLNYVKKKEYGTAYKRVVKLGDSSMKYMLMDLIFKKNSQNDKQKETKEQLYERYANVPEVRSYLGEN